MKSLSHLRRLVLAVALPCLVFVPSADAQDSAAPAALPSAREVLDRHAAATHMPEVVAKTRSMHATGSFSMAAMGLTGKADIWSAKPNLRQVSMEMGGFGTMVTGFDGKTAWMTHPMLGARVLAGTEFLQAMLEAPYDAALKRGELYESMTTRGRETFEGKECYAVELVAKPLEGMDAEATRAARTSVEFYEIASGLQAGTTGRQEGDLGGGPFTSIVSDYKDFGGQLLATKTRIRQGAVEIELSIDTVEYDTATETTFVPPVEIRKMLEPRPEAAK